MLFNNRRIGQSCTHASLCGSGMLASTALISPGPKPVTVLLCFGRLMPGGPTGVWNSPIGAEVLGFRSLVGPEVEVGLAIVNEGQRVSVSVGSSETGEVKEAETIQETDERHSRRGAAVLHGSYSEAAWAIDDKLSVTSACGSFLGCSAGGARRLRGKSCRHRRVDALQPRHPALHHVCDFFSAAMPDQCCC